MTDSYPMTPAGLQKLKADLKHIKEVERPKNIKEIEEALGHGDLRENAEYHAAKETQALLASQMSYFETRIARAQIIDPETIKSEKAGFGATVSLINADTEEEFRYSIVGEDEANADKGRISITSPIARALMGKEEGDEVTVKLPKGEANYEVTEVEYVAIAID